MVSFCVSRKCRSIETRPRLIFSRRSIHVDNDSIVSRQEFCANTWAPGNMYQVNATLYRLCTGRSLVRSPTTNAHLMLCYEHEIRSIASQRTFMVDRRPKSFAKIDRGNLSLLAITQFTRGMDIHRLATNQDWSFIYRFANQRDTVGSTSMAEVEQANPVLV